MMSRTAAASPRQARATRSASSEASAAAGLVMAIPDLTSIVVGCNRCKKVPGGEAAVWQSPRGMTTYHSASTPRRVATPRHLLRRRCNVALLSAAEHLVDRLRRPVDGGGLADRGDHHGD